MSDLDIPTLAKMNGDLKLENAGLKDQLLKLQAAIDVLLSPTKIQFPLPGGGSAVVELPRDITVEGWRQFFKTLEVMSGVMLKPDQNS